MDNFAVPTVREVIDEAAGKFGDKTFIKYLDGESIIERSYNRVRDDSLCLCRYLRNHKAERHHIAVVGKTSYEYIIAATGVMISGNVFIPFSPDISVREALKIFGAADIDMIICDSGFAPTAEEIKAGLPAIKTILNVSAELENIRADYSDSSEYASLSDYKVDVEELSLIIYTSGTTGVRKGVMLSQKALVGNVMYKDYEHCFDETYSSLSILPMFHCFCFSGDFIRNLMDGVTLCMGSGLRDLVPNLLTFKPNVMRLVPMIAASLLQRIKVVESRHRGLSPRKAAEQVLGPNIEWLISGGAYLNPELVYEYENHGVHLRQGYGMTEAGCRISVPDTRCTAESVGRVTTVCDVRIEGGEIQVMTPTFMLGYYKMPEATAEMFTEDGWLRTGDIGTITDDGQLFVTGRLKNLIILSGGENVSPEAIEKKFADCPLVSEVLVYAENDKIVAEFYPDFASCERVDIEDIEAELNEIVRNVNLTSKASHIISVVKVRTEPFEKTGPGKIKRKVTNI